uniref:Uncharacterized protein n=1 Tax=Rhizophora mucronata TaxID=61149 RepID=A0A2P2QZ15_RHIMU
MQRKFATQFTYRVTNICNTTWCLVSNRGNNMITSRTNNNK